MFGKEKQILYSLLFVFILMIFAGYYVFSIKIQLGRDISVLYKENIKLIEEHNNLKKKVEEEDFALINFQKQTEKIKTDNQNRQDDFLYQMKEIEKEIELAQLTFNEIAEKNMKLEKHVSDQKKKIAELQILDCKL